MIAALLLQAAVPTVPMPPADWSTLPVLPLPRAALLMDGSTFVRAEVDSGRCPVHPPQPDGARVIAPIAVLIGPAGAVARIVPRAIGCVTIEQYTVGYVQSLLRAAPQLGKTPTPTPGWYRVTVSYRW